MPSASLVNWRTVRLPSLGHFDAQCAACAAASPANPALLDENLRGYVLLLSAHFQGFCRDLHTEAALVISSKARPSLQGLFQEQFMARRELDKGNAHFGNIVVDFNRVGFAAKPALDALPSSVALKADLHEMNEWRNAAAHHNTVLPPGGPLTVSRIRGWRDSCNTLATSLDAIVYNHLRSRFKKGIWTP